LQRAKREQEYRIDYTQFPLSQLGELMLRACRAKVVNFPHAAVSLQFFEVVVRYHDFFRLCPEFITEILPSFLDEQCVASLSLSFSLRTSARPARTAALTHLSLPSRSLVLAAACTSPRSPSRRASSTSSAASSTRPRASSSRRSRATSCGPS